MPVTNFTKFFAEARDIYLQNLTINQIALEFDGGNGQMMPVIMPPTRDPINLTQQVPFEAVRMSMSFRKMLNRVPSVISVLTEEEYLAYFDKKAKSRGFSSANEAQEAAAREQQNLQRKVLEPPTPQDRIDPLAPDPINLANQPVISADEVINPRVLHLCNQVNAQIPDKEKMVSAKLLDELQGIESALSMDDIQYIRSHGYWKSVKQWAKKVEDARLAAEGDDAGAEEPVAASP